MNLSVLILLQEILIYLRIRPVSTQDLLSLARYRFTTALRQNVKLRNCFLT